MLRRLASFVALAAVASATAQYPGAAPVPARFRPGFDTITQERARELVEFLAGPETVGRGTGQAGFQRAAEYAAEVYRRAGLKPVGEDGTYFQHLTFTRSRPSESSLRVVGGAFDLKSGLSFALRGQVRDLEAEGQVLVVRAGEDATTLPVSDVVNAKVVLLISPGQTERMANTLVRRGAAAVIAVRESVPEAEWTVHPRRGNPRQAAPVAYLNRLEAGRLLEAVGGEVRLLDLSDVPRATADEFALPGSVRLESKVQTEDVQVPNVIGLLEGSDPALRDEVVGIGAHLDHLGIVNGIVFPGADDNASGSAALMQIAEAMAANPLKPRRSILFMLFTGEEMGLLGARHYVQNPVMPNERMVAMLNMDMVGRNEESDTEKAEENVKTIHLIGSERYSKDLHNLIHEQNRFVNFTFEWDEERMFNRSDHAAFAAVGIPIAFLFSGLHADYHQPTDTIEKLNFEKLTNAAKLFYLSAMEIALRDARPRPERPR
jgi:hypothetical protein